MKKKIIIGLVVILLGCFALGGGCVIFGGITYSEGERTGTITKFSRKGMTIKTWEGELSMGGAVQGGTANVWQFSVDDPVVVEAVQQAQRDSGRWTLKYRQQWKTQSWKGATPYFIVEVVNAGAGQ